MLRVQNAVPHGSSTIARYFKRDGSSAADKDGGDTSLDDDTFDKDDDDDDNDDDDVVFLCTTAPVHSVDAAVASSVAAGANFPGNAGSAEAAVCAVDTGPEADSPIPPAPARRKRPKIEGTDSACTVNGAGTASTSAESLVIPLSVEDAPASQSSDVEVLSQCPVDAAPRSAASVGHKPLRCPVCGDHLDSSEADAATRHVNSCLMSQGRNPGVSTTQTPAGNGKLDVKSNSITRFLKRKAGD